MANTSVTAHVVVEFSGADDAPNVLVEIDARDDGYNHGKTNFFPGEEAYILLFVPVGWSCIYQAASAGAVSYVENDSVDIEDFLTFIDDDTASLQYPVAGTPAFTWLGNNLGPITVINGVCSLTPRAYDPNTKTYTPAHRVGVAQVNYQSTARVYRLSSVPVSISKVAVMFVVTKDA